jgi:hypothetical protein
MSNVILSEVISAEVVECRHEDCGLAFTVMHRIILKRLLDKWTLVSGSFQYEAGYITHVNGQKKYIHIVKVKFTKKGSETVTMDQTAESPVPDLPPKIDQSDP